MKKTRKIAKKLLIFILEKAQKALDEALQNKEFVNEVQDLKGISIFW